MAAPTFTREAELIAQGFAVCGVDEAGRGPWAGPVVAAAVILAPANIPSGLNDSKKLTEARRESLFDPIMRAAEVGVGIVGAARIDATEYPQRPRYAAMAEARCGSLARAPTHCPHRRQPRATASPAAVRNHRQRRRQIAVHRRRFDHRQGDARPPDDAISIGSTRTMVSPRHKGYGTAAHGCRIAAHLAPAPNTASPSPRSAPFSEINHS
jgi:hypothetical protein